MTAVVLITILCLLSGSINAHYNDDGGHLQGRLLRVDDDPVAAPTNFKSRCVGKCTQYGTCNEDIARCEGENADATALGRRRVKCLMTTCTYEHRCDCPKNRTGDDCVDIADTDTLTR